MDTIQKLGWKRLFLSPAQKFLLDLQRLGSKEEISKSEKFIIFLEGLTPSALKNKVKRYGRRAVINIYWHLMPKRIKVYKARNPFLMEFLPWFPEGKCSRHLYRLGGNGKILSASAHEEYNQTDYTYSWKKAHFMMLDFKKQVEQEELQAKLDFELKKLKGEIKW